jgi:hypothetical protein
MFTSTLIVAMGSFLFSAGQDAPSWHSDYGSAQRLGTEASMPLAVFVGSGKTGWNQLTPDGLGADAKQLLLKKYICVYVDTTTKAGKQLASEFGMPKGPGLIVSDHTGQYQAFRHQGDLSSEQLVRYLRRYANSNRAVWTTETNPTEPATYSTYSAPVEWYYQPMYYAPISYYTPISSGSC